MSHSGSQARASVQRLLEGLILEQDQFDVHDTLPNTVPDPASLSLTSDYACPQGQVVVAPDCGKFSSYRYPSRWRNTKGARLVNRRTLVQSQPR